jgi:pantoate--beta-alanine ligase
MKSLGFDPVDYLEIRDSETLDALAANNGNARVFVAAYLGATRLIDNVAAPTPA